MEGFSQSDVSCHFWKTTQFLQMIRITFFILLLANALLSCSDQAPIQNGITNFKIFEIAYSNGWSSGFSFRADTNKIYFAPGRADTAYYGLLPVEIVNLLDTTVSKISSDINIKSNDIDCLDCASLAICIVSNGDTIRIKQSGDIDPLFEPIIDSLQNFIVNGEHQRIQALLMLEAKSILLPPPPPYIEEIKFTDIEQK